MSNKKIVIIGTTASNLYGFRKDFILSCLDKEYQVYAFVSEYNQDWIDKIKNLGAQVITYQLSRGGLNPLADIQSLLSLISKIKTIKPDVVFSYTAKPVIYGSIAAHLCKVCQNIGMLEGLGFPFTDQPNGLSKKTKLIKKIQVLLYRFSLPYLTKMIVLNKDDKQDLLDQYKIKVKQLYILGATGLNLEDFPYSSLPQKINFLFIGRLLKEKGIFEFIQAAKQVKKQYPSVQFTVLGAIDHANLGALTQQQLDELIKEQLFDYHGHVDNVVDWIKQSSVFVLPSYREGVPRSTQEAMAVGRPVITTDVPGCRETVIDGVNGFLVPKWSPEALAEKMIYFIEHPEQINIMGLESYKIAQEKFDAHKVNQKLMEIMEL